MLESAGVADAVEETGGHTDCRRRSAAFDASAGDSAAGCGRRMTCCTGYTGRWMVLGGSPDDASGGHR